MILFFKPKFNRKFIFFFLAAFTRLRTCISEVTVIQPILLCLPAWFRIAQCFRRYYDTKQTLSHFFGAIKYCTIFLIVFFAYWNIQSRGKNRLIVVAVEQRFFFEFKILMMILCAQNCNRRRPGTKSLVFLFMDGLGRDGNSVHVLMGCEAGRGFIDWQFFRQ